MANQGAAVHSVKGVSHLRRLPYPSADAWASPQLESSQLHLLHTSGPHSVTSGALVWHSLLWPHWESVGSPCPFCKGKTRQCGGGHLAEPWGPLAATV